MSGCARRADARSAERLRGLPAMALRLYREAETALAGRRPDVAERALISMLAAAPRSVDALRLLGRVRLLQGDAAEAVKLLLRASWMEPTDAFVQVELGIAQFEQGETKAALSSMKKACELEPGLAAAWFNRGRMLRLSGDAAAAGEALQRALAVDREHVPARLLLAEVLTGHGDADAAVAHYRHILRRHPEHAQAWHGLANLKTEKLGAEDVGRLRAALGRRGTGDEARVALGFALAKALEDQGSYAEAFDTLEWANALKRKSMPWDKEAMTRHVDAILHAFGTPARAASDSRLGEEAIFVVSLPRSGSSLVEQIVASHPAVEGGGELLDLQQIIDAESARRGKPFPSWVAETGPQDWERLGRDYLARTASLRARKPKSTDKNLVNWQLVGAAMAMLPGARVINCRRDPLETSISCFAQLFTSGNGFSYSQEDMASYCKDYARLSAHWLRLFPGRFFEHVHESLHADPQRAIRRLLEAAGLDFDPACLEFHRTRREVRTASAIQVRRPLFVGPSRSDRYGSKLDGLKALLASGD
ncbi:hypothetical protein BV497_07695 [Fulvimonas soli]|uniref:Tetratricopeptide repeat protein n=2 Tax=Fulvimonas soli TaxID=155197 RepID=A0A316IH88_9GAMM|nr:tetratricopeptide repeat protein [Fulvimonas soli]TNY26608.1 hypothetical protein BV497_07695 [Fulvimonas soli]